MRRRDAGRRSNGMSYPNRRENVSFTRAFASGAGSGAWSTIMFQPLDVIKTRLQEQMSVGHMPQRNHGMVSAFTWIVRNEGAKSLWSGLIPSLWRCVPGVALYFTSLEASKLVYFRYIRGQNNGDKNLGTIPALVVGATSRTFTGAILMPFTVVKTRFESGTYRYQSVVAALATIYRTEGVKGLFTGLGATLARDVPFSALYFASYTQLKQCMREETVGNNFLCGITAGTLASVVTHPADVVKTNLQLFPARCSRRNMDVVHFVYYSRGLSGFFVGLLPRLVRRTLVSATSWTFYEKIMRSLS